MADLPDIPFLESLAERVRDIQLRYYDRLDPDDIDLKRRRDLLTVADRESERVIVDAIRQRWPGHSVLAEESGADIRESDYCWIVDPLDGTANFARAFPVFAASVALCFRGEPVLGLVEAGRLGERFTAARGEGAWMNGRRLAVSDVQAVGESFLATGFAYVRNEVTRNNVDNFGKLVLLSQDVRRAGAASVDIAYVAAGRFDGFWEPYLKPWDVAAGVLLVREAGGRVSDFAGGEDWLFGENFVASNGRVHDELRSHLSGAEPGYTPWGRDFERRIRAGR